MILRHLILTVARGDGQWRENQPEWSGLLHAVINLTLHVPLLPVHDRLRRWIASAISFERFHSGQFLLQYLPLTFLIIPSSFHDEQFEKRLLPRQGHERSRTR
ncbi:hypothetical protein BDQ94DRAFT_139948 [Aspergillus welwitschiae]|uniref:Uncharacterized protein n=1 Tax=Aspergillus welwitschiae TaxID=1341132 RepID=A0A3F3Q915_9EURO|nr:hypothetical protein BDQ94DRAFT_139948 [Aspergillus welwitschiae]RDH35625.1 hypothetical protein BDQ94DRAFT_139948 [Aspergillus welwitschiae]